MIENPYIAAQERYNNRPYEPMEETTVSTGCRECGEWDARKTYHEGLCDECRLTEYHVLTECGRTLTWSTTDIYRLNRELIAAGLRAKHIQTMEEYEAEQLRLRQMEQVKAVRMVDRARQGRRQGA